jgi:hypothetical protein
MNKLVLFTYYMERLQMAIPDPKSVIQLPWKKDVAWVASDLYMNGSLLEQSPRHILKNQVYSSLIAFAICTSLQVADGLVLHVIYHCFARVPYIETIFTSSACTMCMWLVSRSSALSGGNIVFLRDDTNRRLEISCLHVISPTYSILDLGLFVNLSYIYTSKLWGKIVFYLTFE